METEIQATIRPSCAAQTKLGDFVKKRLPSEPPLPFTVAVTAVCDILRAMHSSRAPITFATPASRIISFIFCILLALLCAVSESAAASAQARRPSKNHAESPKTTLDSYTITQRSDGYRINISYPRAGNPVADAELAIWAREQASAFTQSVSLIPTPPPVPYELFITYETLASSSRVISIVFFISTSMGGTHPEPGMATFVYDRRDGRRLSYGNLFTSQEGLVRAFSEICKKSLTEQLGDRAITHMLEAGTAPDMANFDLFAVVQNGIRIYFPPYQAAPYNEGYLTVAVPLTELAEFSPQMELWDKP